MTTLKEYLDKAKTIDYIPPDNVSINDMDKKEIFFGAISETMTSKYQLKAALIVCEMFPPLKIFFKSQLKDYIKIMDSRNCCQNSLNA